MSATLATLLLFVLLVHSPQPSRRPAAGSCSGKISITAQPVMLAPLAEAGQRLALSGRVLDYAGRPLSRAAVVGYQADARGLYNPSKSPTRVPRLRAVAITEEDGSFGFSTIIPGAYPSRTEPAHIHLIVSAPAHRVSYVEIWFEGDPLITPARLAQQLLPDASTLIVAPRRADSGLAIQCDIKLDGN